MFGKSAVSIIVSCALFSIFAQPSPAVARKGPPIGSAAFKPVLGFNPSCTHKGMSPPVEDLGVNEYEDKVFGYVRYCAVPEGDSVRVKIITNGQMAINSTGIPCVRLMHGPGTTARVFLRLLIAWV